MPNALTTTVSLTPEYFERLNKLKKKSKINKSMLFRMFIDYFDKHDTEFKKLLTHLQLISFFVLIAQKNIWKNII